MTEHLSQQTKIKNRPLRTEPLRAEQKTAVTTPENRAKTHKTGKFISKLGLAALCIIPPADLALLDAVDAKAYTIVQDKIGSEAEPAERTLEMLVTGGLITAQTVALGQALTRTKKLQNGFDDFNDYQEHRHANMKGARKVVSKTLNLPFVGLEKVGGLFEKAGDKMASRKSRIARTIGGVALDLGKINMLGTSAVISQEAMANKDSSVKRQTYLGAMFAASWLVAAEGVRGIYRNVPPLRPPMAFVGRSF